jgi:hypothetical protein
VLAPDWPAGLLVDLAPSIVSRGLVYSRNHGNEKFLQWFKHNGLYVRNITSITLGILCFSLIVFMNWKTNMVFSCTWYCMYNKDQGIWSAPDGMMLNGFAYTVAGCFCTLSSTKCWNTKILLDYMVGNAKLFIMELHIYSMVLEKLSHNKKVYLKRYKEPAVQKINYFRRSLSKGNYLAV